MYIKAPHILNPWVAKHSAQNPELSQAVPKCCSVWVTLGKRWRLFHFVQVYKKKEHPMD